MPQLKSFKTLGNIVPRSKGQRISVKLTSPGFKHSSLKGQKPQELPKLRLLMRISIVLLGLETVAPLLDVPLSPAQINKAL